jgi:hypothetical protein
MQKATLLLIDLNINSQIALYKYSEHNLAIL